MDIIQSFEQLSNQIERLEKQVENIHTAIVGDIADVQKPGIMIRLDRNETCLANFKKKAWFLFAGLTSAIIFWYLK